MALCKFKQHCEQDMVLDVSETKDFTSCLKIPHELSHDSQNQSYQHSYLIKL